MAPIEVSSDQSLALAETGESPSSDVSKRTMLGLPSPLPDLKTERDLPNAAEVKAAAEMSRTVFGMPSPLAKVDPEEAKKTVFGIPSPLAGLTTDEGVAAEPVAEQAAQKTVMGLPSPFAAGAPVQAKPTPKVEQPRTRPMSVADLQSKQTAPPRERTPAAVQAPPKGHPSGHSARDREAAELYAAARFAAAIAEDEKVYATSRHRTALLALLLVSIAAAVAAAFAFREKTRLKAELASEPAVTRSADRFGVVATVRTSEPAVVSYPGGEARGAGEWELQFSVPEADMHVGSNTIHLDAVAEAGGDPVRIPVRIVLYYRFKVPPVAPPKAATPIKAYVEVAEGWKVAVEGGTSTEVGKGRIELALDPKPVLVPDSPGALSVRLALTSPTGESKHFVEALRVPIPDAPLHLTTPAQRWRRAAETVPVRGLTLPGAEVHVGDAHATVGAGGAFDLSVPVALGKNEIDLKIKAPGRKTITRRLNVERLSAHAAKWERLRLKRDTRKWLRGAKRTPKYDQMLAEPGAVEGRKVRIRGQLVEVRRGKDGGPDQLQLVTCIGKGGCPVWVATDGPVLVGQGDKITVVGVLAGVHTFQRGGATLQAPRVDARFVIP